MNNFNELTTRNDFADYLNVSRKTLTYLLHVKRIENLYTTFEVPKKSGETRKICAPMPELKTIQRKLAEVLWEIEKEIRKEHNVKSMISHAFEEDKSIVTNARVHRNKKIIINLDLENFFDSFHFGRVKGFFLKNKNYKVSEEVATTIARLCCYEGKLPQGAPTSPILTNLICNILDMRLVKISKKYRVDYTRYADDLTFSTNDTDLQFFLKEFLDEVENEINKAGFKVNHRKTRTCYSNYRQEVTGLVVNQKINVKKEFYKDTRAMAHSLYSNGEFYINGEKGTLSQLEGRFTFIYQLEDYNNKLNNGEKSFKAIPTLSNREKEYQKFLFYKYFYANDMPLVVTEGKTDVAYIKAALKALYQEYPELIRKDEGDNFTFKIAFLNRTDAIEKLLGIFKDGANAMKNVYNAYSGKSNYPDLSKTFKRFGVTPKKPVIMLFDNEFVNEDKPIRQFAKHISLKGEALKTFQVNRSMHLLENLFVVIPPLIGNLKECEIEDLFDAATLSHQIKGKTFGLKGKFDKEKHYSKEIFSKYILDNYGTINFENFRPLLNDLREIVSNYDYSTLTKEKSGRE